jgi:hypothetical protein
MVLSRIAVHHCGLSGPQQPGTRTLIHVFSLLSQLVRTQTKQCSIRFHMEPSGRSRSQIGPTTGSGFCLDAASCRSVALSRVVAAGSNIIRVNIPTAGLPLAFWRPRTFRTRTDKVFTTASQSSLQLSRFLDDLRG